MTDHNAIAKRARELMQDGEQFERDGLTRNAKSAYAKSAIKALLAYEAVLADYPDIPRMKLGPVEPPCA